MTLQDLLDSRNLTIDKVLRRSARLEAHDEADLELVDRRAAHRAEKQNGNYAAAGIAKPKSGRGLTRGQLASAVAGRALPRRVRAKLMRVLFQVVGDGVDAATLDHLVARRPAATAESSA